MPDDRAPELREAEPGLVARFFAAARDVRRLLYDHLELAALEAQRAASNLVRILAGVVVLAVLFVTAWATLVGAAVVWIAEHGLSLSLALLLAAVANLVVAGAIAFWMRSRVPELLFTATLRQLRRTAGEEELRHAE